MRKDTLYITLSRDITSYTITSGQRAIATNVNYSVTIESPTLTTNLAGRDVSVIISDTDGNTLTTATTFYPDTKNPYKAVTGSLLLDGPVYAKFFDGKPVDTAVRLPIVIRDKSATLLSSDIVVMNGGESAEPSTSDETVAGLVNAIRFYDLAEFKSWLEGTKTRDDGLLPTDIVVGQWVHTQNDGSFICKELIGAEPSVAKNFTAIVTQFPLTGTLKMNPDNGVGLSVYSGDVYNESEATSFSTDAITCKGEAFTFNAGDNQIARQKDNYALENRVNSKMDATLAAIKADNDETYNDMLPVMNTTVEARDRAETAASNAKASETRAVSAETNAATSEQNAEAYKKSAAVSEANAGLYRRQALAYAQKAETEAKTATDKATEASNSASEASSSSSEALAYKNDASDYAEAARISAEASAGSAASSAASADASKSSAETAAQSETIAVGSAAAAASSESTASQYKDTAVSASSLAVTSKDSASNFADASAASASAAASSASAAASYAAAAKQSETDLADAVATADGLDGRIAKIETGKNLGFLASGGFQAYTQLNAGDGSFKVLKDLPNMKKVAIKEYDDIIEWSSFDDGNYAYVYSGQWMYGEHRLFLFDSDLKVFAGPINNGGGFDNSFLNTSMKPSKIYYHAENERLYGVEGLYLSRLKIGCMSKDGERLKAVLTSIQSNGNNGNGSGCVVYNKQSGHLIAFYIYDYYNGVDQTLWYQAFDLDLNPVLNEDGTERITSVLNDVKRGGSDVIFSVKYIEDVVFLIENGGLKNNARIFTLNEQDELVVLHEGLVQEDEDGNMLCETQEVTDEEGNTTVEYVLDAPKRNKMVRPILSDGGEYHFNVAINEEARPKLTAGKACRRNPVFCYSNGFYFMNDGVDVYVILKSGEIVDTVTMPGNWTSGKHGKPYTKAKGDRSGGFTNSSQKLYCISGNNLNRFTPSLVYDKSTGNDLSNWRRMTKLNFILEAGNILWPCIPCLSAEPSVAYQASPFKANWLLFGNLLYTNINMIIDHNLTYL